MSSDLNALLRTMYCQYAKGVGLDDEACYLDGTPLRPVVPLDCGLESIFFLGAYPSARFMVRRDQSDVPVADNLGPFEAERWFDGTRTRRQASAHELQELFLKPLALDRSRCWITDLVKVFLFKEGHAEKYRKLGATAPRGYDRGAFFDIGEKSLPWIRREIEFSRPRLVVTLGAEVAGVLHGVRSSAKQVGLLAPQVEEIFIGGMPVSAIHCAHPGILMRPGERNPWPRRHLEEFIPAIKKHLGQGT